MAASEAASAWNKIPPVFGSIYMWVSLIGCAKSKPLYTLVEGQSQTANCITENVTLGSIVASGKMLLSGRRKRLSEGYHDETEKQARVVGSGAAKYLKANKLEKQTMLDEFTAATGYHRKYVIRVLKNQRQVQNCLKGKGETCQFAYNGDGQRVKSVINGETIQFVNGYYEKKGSEITKYYMADTWQPITNYPTQYREASPWDAPLSPIS